MEHQSLNVPVAMTETLMEFELAELIPLETLQWYRPAWELKIAFFLREVWGVQEKDLLQEFSSQCVCTVNAFDCGHFMQRNCNIVQGVH